MKRIFILMLSMIALIAINANPSPDLKSISEKANAACPVVTDDGLTLQSVAYDPGQNCIIYSYSVDESVIPFTQLSQHSSLLKDGKIAEIATSSEPNMMLLKDSCTKANANLVYVFKSGDKSFQIVITPADLQ